MKAFVLATSLLVAGAALAHEAIGPNGGRLVDAGNLHVELVPKGKAITVFVSDANEKPLSVEGYKGTAVLVIGGKPHRIQLAPANENRLIGIAEVDVPTSVKGAVQLSLPIGGSVQGRFQ
jgi:hypothetical protein